MGRGYLSVIGDLAVSVSYTVDRRGRCSSVGWSLVVLTVGGSCTKYTVEYTNITIWCVRDGWLRSPTLSVGESA